MKSQYLVFNISKENYLIDISKVREVISISKFERVPNADSYILGVINLRGEVISIINSSVILNTHIENINSPSNELPTPNVSLRYTLGIGFSFAICKGITVQW